MVMRYRRGKGAGRESGRERGRERGSERGREGGIEGGKERERSIRTCNQMLPEAKAV